MTQSRSDNRTTLSPEGNRRKAAIRAAACKATADRRRGARFVTTIAVAALPLILAVAVWSQLPTRAGLLPAGDGVRAQATPDANSDSTAGNARLTEIVQNDGTPVYRNIRFVVIADRPAVVVHTIDDDELLDLLARAGRPSGLIRIGDRVMVVEHARVARQSTDVPDTSRGEHLDGPIGQTSDEASGA